MTKLPRQTKRRELVKRLRELGFSGPEIGVGDHPEYMVRGTTVLKLPNPHRGDIGIDLLTILLKEGGISRKEWLGQETKDDEQQSDDPDDDEQ
jgi:hypothetical protein